MRCTPTRGKWRCSANPRDLRIYTKFLSPSLICSTACASWQRSTSPHSLVLTTTLPLAAASIMSAPSAATVGAAHDAVAEQPCGVATKVPTSFSAAANFARPAIALPLSFAIAALLSMASALSATPAALLAAEATAPASLASLSSSAAASFAFASVAFAMRSNM